MKKIIVNFYSLAGCEGCAVQLLNLITKRLDLLQYIEFNQFRLIGFNKEVNECDVAIIDGSIVNRENEEKVISIRKNAKTLIAIGSCATLGGVQLATRFIDIRKAIEKVYGKNALSTIRFNRVKPINEVVNVDYEIPGCPVEIYELERLLIELISNAEFRILQKSVCFECKLRENACLLDKGILCLGPLTLGGCNAKCPSIGAACYGCRGTFEDHEINEFIKIAMNKGFSIDEILNKLKIFMEEVIKEIDNK